MLDSQNILGVCAKLMELDVGYSMEGHSSLADAMELTRYAAFVVDLYTISSDFIENEYAT